MEEIRLKRNGREDFVFTGELLVTMDDRNLMGSTPNWWELTIYITSTGKYILGSTFHINYPKRKQMFGAICFSTPEGVREYLVTECNGPSMIADTLLARAARKDSAFLMGPNNKPKGLTILPHEACDLNIAEAGIA